MAAYWEQRAGRRICEPEHLMFAVFEEGGRADEDEATSPLREQEVG